MAAQVDGSWCDVYVHEVVNYSALNVVLDPVHKVSTSHIKDLYVGEFPDQIYGIEDKKSLKLMSKVKEVFVMHSYLHWKKGVIGRTCLSHHL